LTQTELKLLMIAYNFPPDSEVGARRVAGLCRYLPEFGIRPIVLTVEERFYSHPDPGFSPPDELQIERTRVMTTPLEAYARWTSWRGLPAPGDRTMPKGTQSVEPSSYKRHILALLQTPDAFWGWYLPAVRAGIRLMKQQPIDAILSTAPPWTSHLIACKLAGRSGRPWFADFRDPWWGNPQRRALPKWRDPVHRWLEARCIRTATRVVCNTDRMRQFYADRYKDNPSTKFFTLPNGYDDFARPSPSERTDSRRLILHLGDIYGTRRIDSFCDAVVQLVETERLDPLTIRILFLGTIAPEQYADARRRLANLVPFECIEFRPRISWDAAQKALWSADLLLLFQGGFRLQVPAKFFEYLHTGKPILALAEEGALTDLIQETQAGSWCDPSDAKSIGNKLLRALELPARAPEEAVRSFSGQYHYRSIARQLAAKLRQVIAETRMPG
jgi:glycosyltransferase involved in cell wall biosynthesis